MDNHDKAPIKINRALIAIIYVISFTVFVTVFNYIDFLWTALFLTLFLAAVYGEYREHFLPRSVLTLSSFVVLGFFLYNIRLEDLPAQAVEALLVMLAIKLLEKKLFRDYMQVLLIALFILAGSATAKMEFSISMQAVA